MKYNWQSITSEGTQANSKARNWGEVVDGTSMRPTLHITCPQGLNLCVLLPTCSASHMFSCSALPTRVKMEQQSAPESTTRKYYWIGSEPQGYKEERERTKHIQRGCFRGRKGDHAEERRVRRHARIKFSSLGRWIGYTWSIEGWRMNGGDVKGNMPEFDNHLVGSGDAMTQPRKMNKGAWRWDSRIITSCVFSLKHAAVYKIH